MQVSRVARPGVVIAAGWLAVLAYAFPGVMTEESFEYLRQARTKFFDPANPPGISALWRHLELLLAGPTVMLLVQSGAFAFGAYQILQRVLSPIRAACAVAVLLVVPPILVPMSAIWSHSMMTGLLTLGAAALLTERTRIHRAGLGVLFVATVVQPSALTATLPLVVGWFCWQPALTGARRFLIAGGTWLVISGAALLATKHYAKAPVSAFSYVVPREEPPVTVPSRALPEPALKLGVPTRSTAIQDAWTSVHQTLDARTPLFSPWPYFALLALLIPFAMRQRDVAVLLASALAFHATGIFTGWLAVATLLAAILVVARRTA